MLRGNDYLGHGPSVRGWSERKVAGVDTQGGLRLSPDPSENNRVSFGTTLRGDRLINTKGDGESGYDVLGLLVGPTSWGDLRWTGRQSSNYLSSLRRFYGTVLEYDG